MNKEITGEEARANQRIRILAYIDQHGSITQKEADRELDIMRLSARIFEIRTKLGIDISSIWITGVNRFGERTRYVMYKKAV